MKIFISSRLKELEKERGLARDAVKETGRDLNKNLIPVLVEHGATPPSTTVNDQCCEEVKDCKAVICIYYKTVSEIVKNEFLWANERGIPVFIFKKEPQGRDEADEELKGFIKEEVRPPSESPEGPYLIYIYKTFAGEDIKRYIIDSLKEYYPKWFNFRSIPERYIPSVVERERLDRIRHVYIRPKCYHRAEEILKNNRILIITGPAHLGKTSMGFHLADSLQKTLARPFLIFPETEDFTEMENICNSVILFDDPFGGVTFNNPLIGDRFGSSLHALARGNYIIITSRREVLDEACKYTKLGEKRLEDITIEMTQDDYNDKDFGTILEKHLEYFKAGCDIRTLANNNKKAIVKELRFPHNYEVLVREELAEVDR